MCKGIKIQFVGFINYQSSHLKCLSIIDVILLIKRLKFFSSLKVMTQYIPLVFWHMILEFAVSGPHKFQVDSIILQNSKFQGPVDRMKKP